jgi:hypothetical protein
MMKNYLFPLILLLFIASLTNAAIINVPDDQPTIQAGVFAAAQYDTVLVADGVYTGDGNRDISIVNTTIIIKSESGPKNCVIDCQGTAGEHHQAFDFGTGGNNMTVLDGFTITNGWHYYGTIHISDSTSPTIRNCHITGNATGIYIAWNLDMGLPHIDSCIISDNNSHGLLVIGNINMSNTLVAHNGGTGLITVYHPGINLLNCTFVFNDSTGVDLYGDPPKGGTRADSALIRRCISAFNGGYGFDKTFYLPASYFYCNNAYGNATADYGAVNASANDIYGNISLDPMFCDTSSFNFHLDYNSPCVPANNDCGVLMGAQEAACGDLCGDLTGDGLVNILDVIAMIECIYGIGECPPGEEIDVNNDGSENILDITYLIAYLYQDGPPPDCT